MPAPRASEPAASEPPTHTYEYAIVRVVPRVERGEFLNVGAIVYCKARGFLEARIALDRARLAALFPFCEADALVPHLEAIARVCRGGAEAGALGALSQVERFHWLVAPRSTIIQPSPVHAGRCADPAATLEELIARMVRLPVTDEREPAP
ncbi:MAG TPA: DUF3037 domain-containing protein [Ktedonobacterales bacterium]